MDSFAKVAAAKAEDIKAILEAASETFHPMDTTTWPEQAALAAEGKWDELQALQDKLMGGREA
jgi:large subunit ribosomal protein L21